METKVRSNEYSAGMRRLPEEKLIEYVENPDDFHSEAVQAAIWEISNRRNLNKKELILEKLISENIRSQDFEGDDSAGLITQSTLSIPSLYSMRSIQIFSVLFSVFAGGILMAINFNRVTLKTEAIKVIAFSLAYTLLSFTIFALLGTQSPILTIILNLLGAFLIDQLFWKRVLGAEFRYNSQQIWTALLLALIIISPLVWYAIKSGIMNTL